MRESDMSNYSPANGGKKALPSDLQLLGTQLGGCQITDFIGRGGMGTVFKATHTALNREVAIKILSTKDQDEKAIEWFLREARSIARLEHPNIIQVHDLSYDESLGVYYIIMQYINGPSLDILVKGSDNGFLLWQEASEYVLQGACGLGAAHQEGIIHRDVKPSNIMITKEKKVKIADFGLAKGVVTDEVAASGSVIVGTPLYMAPEQCVGGNIDQRADIYSLGASYYYLLTGKSPIRGDNTYEILEKQITEMPSAPDQEIEGIPAEVSEIVMRMLAKNPQDRYQQCEEIVVILRSLLYGDDGSSPSGQGSVIAQQGFRTSGIDKVPLIKALKDIAVNRYQGMFTFRSRESEEVQLYVAEEEVAILQQDVDMYALLEEYSQYQPIELVSLLLIQILSWEAFTWEFSEEDPLDSFHEESLVVKTDKHSFLFGYAGIIQVAVDLSCPGALSLVAPLNSCTLQYMENHIL